MKRQLIVAAALLTAVLTPAVASAEQEKRDVCHLESDGRFHLVDVAEPAWLNGHLEHGDGLPGGPVPGQPGYAFDAACVPVLVPWTLSASSVYAGRGPELAFDGDEETWWNAASWPPQWIRVDFGVPRTLDAVRAVVEQTPSGDTVHELYVDNQLVATLTGYTETGSVLLYEFTNPLEGQIVEIRTVSSPSWSAWREVQFEFAEALI